MASVKNVSIENKKILLLKWKIPLVDVYIEIENTEINAKHLKESVVVCVLFNSRRLLRSVMKTALGYNIKLMSTHSADG